MKKDKMLYYLLSRQTDALGNLENKDTLGVQICTRFKR
jgi:hypothetical protein